MVLIQIGMYIYIVIMNVRCHQRRSDVLIDMSTHEQFLDGWVRLVPAVAHVYWSVTCCSITIIAS